MTETTISLEYTSELFKKLRSIQEEIGDVPEEFETLREEMIELINKTVFKKDDWNSNDYEKVATNVEVIRPDGLGFDINRFLEVLDKVKLKKDIILEYTYDLRDSDAKPLVYTRPKEGKPINNYMKYKETYGYGDVRPYLADIIIENDPESFFQLVIFSVVVDQFYLQWHSNYNDYTFIYSKERLEEVLSSIPDGDGRSSINQENREHARQLSLNPIIDIKEDSAECCCLMFTKWGGFYNNKATITYPELSIKNEREYVISYMYNIEY